MMRTPQGKWVQENPEVTGNIEKRIVSLKKAVHRAQRLKALDGNDGWECVKEILQDRISALQFKRRNFDSKEMMLDQGQLELIVKEENVVERFMEIIDDFNESVPGFLAALDRSEKELESRARSGTT